MSTFHIPHSIAIGGNHMKRVIARWNASVVSRTPCASLDPIGIETFHFVLEPDLTGFDKTKRGVSNVEAGLCGSQSGGPDFRSSPPVHQRLFNQHWRWMSIYLRSQRSQHSQPIRRR